MREPEDLQSTRTGSVYRLGRPFRIGAEQMHEAFDDQRRRFWIKQVPADDEGAIAQLRYEAIILGKLQDTGVVRLCDRGRNRAVFFLVLDPPSGRPLRQSLDDAAPSLGQLLRLAAQLADLLVYLHAQGIFCCVLPPEHLYLDHLGRVTLVSLAEAYDEIAPARRVNLASLLAYRSPEQISGVAAERRSDIYSFGVLLFELLAGRPPFIGESSGDLALQHLLTAPPDLRELRPDAPPALAALVARCLAKAPAQRFPNALALLAELRALEVADGRQPVHVSLPNGHRHEENGLWNSNCGKR